MDLTILQPQIQFYVNKMRHQYAATKEKYPFRHLSMVFYHNFLCEPITYGTNSDRIFCCGIINTHAEMDVINKILSKINKYKRKKIDLMVIRINSLNELRESKPCLLCLQYLIKNKHLNIKNIYYSNALGNIVKTTIKELENISRYSKKYQK